MKVGNKNILFGYNMSLFNYWIFLPSPSNSGSIKINYGRYTINVLQFCLKHNIKDI